MPPRAPEMHMRIHHAAHYLPQSLGTTSGMHKTVREARSKAYWNLFRDTAELSGDKRLADEQRIPKAIALFLFSHCCPKLREYDISPKEYNCMDYYDRVVTELGSVFGCTDHYEQKLFTDCIFYDLYDQNTGEGFDDSLCIPVYAAAQKEIDEARKRASARFTPLDEATIRSIVTAQFRVPGKFVVPPAKNQTCYFAVNTGLDTHTPPRCTGFKVGWTSKDIESRLRDSQVGNAMPMPYPLVEFRGGTVSAHHQADIAEKLSSSRIGFYKKEANRASLESSAHEYWLERAAQMHLLKCNTKVLMGDASTKGPFEVFYPTVNEVVELIEYLRTNFGVEVHGKREWFDGPLTSYSKVHQAVRELCFPDDPVSAEGNEEIVDEPTEGAASDTVMSDVATAVVATVMEAAVAIPVSSAVKHSADTPIDALQHKRLKTSSSSSLA